MAERANAGTQYRFGVFELDVSEKELRKYGSRIKLQGQPFLVLSRLVENAGHLVSREALKGELWPEDTFVDFEHSLNEAVNKLRTALGDSAARPRFVETVPRHGYRFIAEVERISLPETASGPAPPPRERSTSRLLVSAVAALAVVVVLLGLLVRARAPSDEMRIRSLAVLPFENLSGDAAQDYVSDGFTDELTLQLARIPELQVISRTSARRYKSADKSLREIGRELGVDALVEGSVRLVDGKARVTVQLVQAASDRSLWTEAYEGTADNVLDIQNEVARSIAREVRAELTAREEARLAARKVSSDAFLAYLKGRHHWNLRTDKDFQKAIEYFTEATTLEPAYAEAWAGLADTYNLLAVYNLQRPARAMPRAKDAVREALRIDPNLAEAHASYGCILFAFDWNWEEAESEFKKSIELNPGYASTYQCYGVFLIALSRVEEGLAALRRAVELDPLSLTMNETLGWALFVARRYPEAIDQFQRTLELDPRFGQALRYLGLTYLHLGMHQEALQTLTKARQTLADEPDVQSDLALAHALAGRREEAERLLAELTAASSGRYVSPFLIASFHVGLGDFDSALDWLEKAYDERVANVVFLGVDPAFDPLRAHPRFQTLLRRIGL